MDNDTQADPLLLHVLRPLHVLSPLHVPSHPHSSASPLNPVQLREKTVPEAAGAPPCPPLHLHSKGQRFCWVVTNCVKLTSHLGFVTGSLCRQVATTCP